MPTRTDLNLSLRPLDTSDIDQIVRIHCAAFPKAALTNLGTKAVSRYYMWQLEGPHDETSAFGVTREGELEGFCFGGVHPTAISGFLDKNKTFLAWHIAMRPWLIANPLFRDKINRGLKIWKRMFWGSSPQKNTPVQSHMKLPFDILSIAVHPRAQGLGMGQWMMEEAEAVARRTGFYVMSLFVQPDNAQAIRFYEAGGWEKRIQQGVWRGVMEKWLVPREVFLARLKMASTPNV